MAEQRRYSKKKTKKNNGIRNLLAALIVGLSLILVFIVALIMRMEWHGIPEVVLNPNETTGEAQQTEPLEHNPPATEYVPIVETQETVPLNNGLVIDSISSYTGMYMEDGTDEIVSGVMMIILRNNSEQDLQLARINVNYDDVTAEFEVSNLPAGEMAVLLEQNRAALPSEAYNSVEVQNVAFFQEPMSLREDLVKITGGNGYLDVTNVSDEDLTGAVRVFYKNSAVDILYGGITYVASVKEGIPAGETVRILTGHYAGENSRIVNVTVD